MPASSSEPPRGSLTVTEAARSYLADQLDEHGSDDVCYRLHTGADHRISTVVVAPPPREDVLVRHDGKVILAVEPDLAASLRDSTIDVEPTRDGRKALIVV